MSEQNQLPQGRMAEIVADTFRRSGIEEIVPHTPAELMVRVAEWDGLLNPMELQGLKMVVRLMTPMRVGGFVDET